MAIDDQIQKTLISTTNEKPPLSAEITSEENLIDEDDLELSLGIRPINYWSCSPTPVTKTHLSRPRLLSEDNAFRNNRDVRALRRFEAKKKRDLKRIVSGGKVSDVEREVMGCVLKVPRLNGSYSAPPSWLTWHNNNDNNNNNNNTGGLWSRGQNGNFSSPGTNVNFDESISTGSSSGVSDNNYQCFPGPGGNTSSADVISHSSQSQTPTNSPLQPCLSQPEPQQQPNSSTPNATHLQTHLSSSSNHSEQLTNLSQQSSKSPNSITTSLEKNPSLTTQSSMTKEAKGKPPRPNGQIKQQKTTLPQMPCVSVTGNGPDGKTITGILYKYTKTEVSIVCVCHGASFSPAGFVEHAGGVDVDHPLRHIRVVPFAL